MEDVSLIFDNDKIDCSGHMDFPTKTGEYLVYLQDNTGKNYFAEIYYRTDVNKFYFHEYCELQNDIESYWHCEVVHWLLLKTMLLSEFDIH